MAQGRGGDGDLSAVTYERLSDEFAKVHLSPGRALHIFTGPDRGGPHDHPFSIEAEVLSGGYVERIWSPHTMGHVDCVRNPGDRFTIPAWRIHEIVALPTGECVTMARYGEAYRKTRFWRFDRAIVESRAWDEDWPTP